MLFRSGVMALFWPIPIFTYWLAIVFTVLGLMMVLERENSAVTGKQICGLIAALIVVNGLVSFAAQQVSMSSVASLTVEALRYPILICLFVFSLRQTKTAAKA